MTALAKKWGIRSFSKQKKKERKMSKISEVLIEEETYMTNKHIKTYLNSLVIRGIKTQITMKYNFLPSA